MKLSTLYVKMFMTDTRAKIYDRLSDQLQWTKGVLPHLFCACTLQNTTNDFHHWCSEIYGALYPSKLSKYNGKNRLVSSDDWIEMTKEILDIDNKHQKESIDRLIKKAKEWAEIKEHIKYVYSDDYFCNSYSWFFDMICSIVSKLNSKDFNLKYIEDTISGFTTEYAPEETN